MGGGHGDAQPARHAVYFSKPQIFRSSILPLFITASILHTVLLKAIVPDSKEIEKITEEIFGVGLKLDLHMRLKSVINALEKVFGIVKKQIQKRVPVLDIIVPGQSSFSPISRNFFPTPQKQFFLACREKVSEWKNYSVSGGILMSNTGVGH